MTWGTPLDPMLDKRMAEWRRTLNMSEEEKATARLEKRMAEIEAEAEYRKNRISCLGCRYHKADRCHEPLVVGFGKPEFVGRDGLLPDPVCAGPLRKQLALYKPRPSLWQRIKEWFDD